ncbi:hypothetical protein HKCCSP123_09865 [Rhodobacterales bacterium HKCCSP123]|nr:hypothetical protein [Rhodobacterales bacterium HKCCSP123]
MEPEILTRVRLSGGRYEGLMTAADGSAGVEAVFEGRVVATASISADPARQGGWRVAIDLPAEVIGEGVQVIALRSVASGEVLDRITLMSGAPLDEDIREELALVRDELEMMKRAFRRHCAETGSR